VVNSLPRHEVFCFRSLFCLRYWSLVLLEPRFGSRLLVFLGSIRVLPFMSPVVGSIIPRFILVPVSLVRFIVLDFTVVSIYYQGGNLVFQNMGCYVLVDSFHILDYFEKGYVERCTEKLICRWIPFFMANRVTYRFPGLKRKA